MLFILNIDGETYAVWRATHATPNRKFVSEWEANRERIVKANGDYGHDTDEIIDAMKYDGWILEWVEFEEVTD